MCQCPTGACQHFHNYPSQVTLCTTSLTWATFLYCSLPCILSPRKKSEWQLRVFVDKLTGNWQRNSSYKKIFHPSTCMWHGLPLGSGHAHEDTWGRRNNYRWLIHLYLSSSSLLISTSVRCYVFLSTGFVGIVWCPRVHASYSSIVIENYFHR